MVVRIGSDGRLGLYPVAAVHPSTIGKLPRLGVGFVGPFDAPGDALHAGSFLQRVRAVRGDTPKIRAASSMEMNGRPRRSSSVSALTSGWDVGGELTYPL